MSNVSCKSNVSGIASLPDMLMRLVVQAQASHEQHSVLEAFDRLSEEDKKVLIDEMSLTGCAGQSYSTAPPRPPGEGTGPAFLVYYSPAFVRSVAKDDGAAALRMLAEVYRQARHLWPHGGGEEGPASVTIRIDQLKDATVELIQEAFVYGDGWFISRRNALEGVVERHPLLSMQGAQGYRLLAFWRRPADVDAYEGL